MDEITRKIMELDLEHLTREESDWLHSLVTLAQCLIAERFITKSREDGAL
jgi:hypothetical protein